MTEFKPTDVNNYFIDEQNNVYMCIAYIEEPHVELINVGTLNKLVVEKSDRMNKFKRLITDPRDIESLNTMEKNDNDKEDSKTL